MKIFLTGGGGFLGSHLAKELIKEGHEVTSFSRSKYPYLEKIGVNCIKGDLRNIKSISKALTPDHQAIFHTASKVNPNFFGIAALFTFFGSQ